MFYTDTDPGCGRGGGGMMSETGLEDAQSRQISTSFAEHTIPMGGLPNTSFIRGIKKSSNTTLKLVNLSMLTIVAGALEESAAQTLIVEYSLTGG